MIADVTDPIYFYTNKMYIGSGWHRPTIGHYNRDFWTLMRIVRAEDSFCLQRLSSYVRWETTQKFELMKDALYYAAKHNLIKCKKINGKRYLFMNIYMRMNVHDYHSPHLRRDVYVEESIIISDQWWKKDHNWLYQCGSVSDLKGDRMELRYKLVQKRERRNQRRLHVKHLIKHACEVICEPIHLDITLRDKMSFLHEKMMTLLKETVKEQKKKHFPKQKIVGHLPYIRVLTKKAWEKEDCGECSKDLWEEIEAEHRHRAMVLQVLGKEAVQVYDDLVTRHI